MYGSRHSQPHSATLNLWPGLTEPNMKKATVSDLQSRSDRTDKAAVVSLGARIGSAFVVAFIFCFLLASSARGQLYTGSIAGTITDPSGAVVPGVQVRATDEGKGFTFTATTDSAGRYVLRQLPPAKYTVSAAASGFTPERKTGVTIDVNQNASVDFALKVGSVSEV